MDCARTAIAVLPTRSQSILPASQVDPGAQFAGQVSQRLGLAGWGSRMLALVVVLLFTGFAPASGAAHAEDRVLTLSIGPEARRFTAAQLLGRPDAAELTIP